MKIISTSTHAKIDYLAAIVFMASPWIFGFKESVPATWTMIAVGLMVLLMSLFTDYEGGMVRSIPMRVHLTADVFAGAFLASSPWLLGFAQEVVLPQMIMGLFSVFTGLLTSKHPAREHSGAAVEPGARD
ncbi:SPW repeat protein [Dyadobacter sp. 676]|uniref:SPW repeat protein n=1 Tax=Dyadobacter sp. 676 TaxID=3088362 RepID=A0AAU8FII9_9BACT